MEVKQIADFVNAATFESTGQTGLVTEDLGGVVETGDLIFNNRAFDNYTNSLLNQVGKIVFVNRPYRGSAPSVLMDNTEYGSITMKIASYLPVATENEKWELEDGASYDPNVFYQPKVSSKFYNNLTTFEIDRSITEAQVKQSFQNGSQLNAFVSMLFNEIEKSLTVKFDQLIMRTINNMIAETVYNAYQGSAITTAGDTRAINLLPRYNTQFNKSLTASAAMTDREFIRYAAFQLSLYTDRLTRLSQLFNVGGMDRFTPRDLLHVVMLSEFASAADIYLQSDTFHDSYTKLINAERVPYWQATGTDFNFSSTGTVKVKTTEGHTQTVTGVIAVMFDRDALGVNNYRSQVDTHYNPKANFTNYFYKKEARYFNDFNENFVVFFVA